MTISIWRYSHLALAVSSSLLLLLASVTGIILSFQPISEKNRDYRIDNFEEITLAQSIPIIRQSFPDISELIVDDNQFVQIKASDTNGRNVVAFVNPLTGKILGTGEKDVTFFEWTRSFHRSLFLHDTGRLFIGITAFLLMLIAISGTVLIIQRQRGLKRFFSRIVRDSFAQYYHVLLSRLLVAPILIIAITGTYLSLTRFGIINIEKESTKVDINTIRSKPKKESSDMEIFKSIRISEVESIEFPFTEEVEDYYIVKMNDREIAVNQITGDLLAEVKYPKGVVLSNLSLDLHTGRASAIWAIILAIATCNIIFFIYSGFVMTFKRRSGRISNKYQAKDCTIIILVGSENGTTYSFAKAVYQQLIKLGQKSYITELNSYTIYPEATHIIVLTATYGIGEAPTNANKFKYLINRYPQRQPVLFSVVGFGSKSYPDFCKSAFETHQLFSSQAWAKPILDIHTVNDRSPHDFGMWAEAWSQQSGLAIMVPPSLLPGEPRRLNTFMVRGTTTTDESEEAFSILLKSKRKLKVASGDLLAIFPTNDHRERLYSIGMVGSEIQLNVRLHKDGLGSGFLHRLKTGETILGQIKTNERFHFPNKASAVIMICNGTGIAPFLGMISQNTKKKTCHLYCGFRGSPSFSKHQLFLEQNIFKRHLRSLQIAFSREGERLYVSHLLLKDSDLIANIIIQKGVIMICGSLDMQKDVMAILEDICQTKTGKSLSFYQSHNQILTDCY